MGSEDHILFGIEDGVGVVTLNRPDRLNAINWDLGRDLVKLFEDLRMNDEVRVIVLTGAGRGFCAGGDAEWLSGSSDRGRICTPVSSATNGRLVSRSALSST